MASTDTGVQGEGVVEVGPWGTQGLSGGVEKLGLAELGLGTQQEEQGTDGWGDTGWLKVRKWSPTAAPASTAALTPSPCLPGPSGCRLQDRALPLLLTWKGGGDSSSHGVPPPRGVTWTSPDAVPIGPRP